MAFGAQLQLGPVLGQVVSSVVHIGTWNRMQVAVKMVVLQQAGLKGLNEQQGTMLSKSQLQVGFAMACVSRAS